MNGDGFSPNTVGSGKFTTKLIRRLLLNVRYCTPRDSLAQNYLLAALAGTTWFLRFFFYGMGASNLSKGASSWTLHMAFIIIVATCWGIVF